MQSVGMIRQLARFPVKSMRGEAMDSMQLTLQGFPQDRRYAFVQAASRSSFPWFTAREMPELLCYRTSVDAADQAEAGVTVMAPSGQSWRVESEELRRELETRSGRALFLLRDHRGSYDAAQVSLISRQTVAKIADESGTPENPWRFRPNLLVDLTAGEAFQELNWVGRVLRLGAEARISVTETDQRCMMITLDPATAEPSPAVMRCVAQRHGQSAGVYAAVLTPGEVRAGDPVAIED